MHPKRRAASLLLGVVLAACVGTPATPTPAGSLPAPSPTPSHGATALPTTVVAAESPGPAPAPTLMSTAPLTPGHQPTPAAPVATPPSTPSLEDPIVGRMAVVVTDTRLVVRSAPGTDRDSKIRAWYLYPQQRAEVVEGPVLASGYPWYRIRVNEDEGWVAGRSRTAEPWLAAASPDLAIVAGGHTCVLTGAGGVKCWGVNRFGQLGDGTTATRHTPVDVAGLARGVGAITVGRYHTCALTSAGGVKCWGDNRRGQLGDGTTKNRTIPVDVRGLPSGVTAISAGIEHTCALTDAGGIKCWGMNRYGRLGDGTTASSTIPVDVAGLGGEAVAVAAGGGYTCALLGTGGVTCWGDNRWGQLGDGTTVDSSVPIDVSGLGGATAIAVGADETCALTVASGVKCWGDNRSGQLGDGTTASSAIPVDVAGLGGGAIAITIGGFYTCALTNAGGVKCWGGNYSGELGDGSRTSRLVPVDVVGLSSGVRAITAGSSRTCAITAAGGVKCWGSHIQGQLAYGSTTDRRIPVDVDFSVRQATTLQASTHAWTIARGTRVTFTATVSPLGPSGTSVIVRFLVERRASPRAAAPVAQRDVRADTTGRATFRWTPPAAGTWIVRAQALDNERYAASWWGSFRVYSVP